MKFGGIHERIFGTYFGKNESASIQNAVEDCINQDYIYNAPTNHCTIICININLEGIGIWNILSIQLNRQLKV